MSTNHRRPVLTVVDQLLAKLVQLEKCLSTFSDDQQSQVESLLNEYTETLAKLQNLCGILEDDIPMDLVNFLDDGGNPDVFTKGLFMGSVTANQEAKGKIVAFKKLSQNLEDSLKEVYPEESAAFQQLEKNQSSMDQDNQQGPEPQSKDAVLKK